MIKIIIIILFISNVFSGTDLYVGYNGKNSNEAIRVTIHIKPVIYRQQIMVQTPYITFVNDEPSNGDVLLLGIME